MIPAFLKRILPTVLGCLIRRHRNKFALSVGYGVLLFGRQHQVPYVTKLAGRPNSFMNYVYQQIVEPEASTEGHFHVRISKRLFLQHLRDVQKNMEPHMKEVGNDHHTLAP